jgi:hypothetical protein
MQRRSRANMSHYNDPEQYDSISEIEDLDPEPEIKPGLVRKRELILGGLLLAAVIFFACWQWWHQEYQASQYRAGKEAIDNNRWEAAARYFHEAAGYNDSDVLAKNSQQQVEQRDRLYKSANEHIDRGEWLHALSDIRAIGRIQPGYRDIEVREKLVTDMVYKDALGGTVTMREAASPPGLYFRTPTAWVWLEGSDTKSLWTSNDQQDHFVFDVKDPAATASPDPTPDPSSYMSDRYANRKLIVAQVSDNKLTYSELPLELATYGPAFASSNGLWAFNYEQYPLMGNNPYLLISNAFWGASLRYQAYSSAVSAPVELTVTNTYTTGEVITFVDPASNRYIVAEWINGQSYGPDEDTIINLYTGAAGEQGRQLVYTHTGGRLESAQLSPDGRYMVVTTQSPLKSSLEMVTTNLIDLAGSAPPRVIKEVVRYARDPGRIQAVSTAFVRQGVYAGKLVLVEYGAQGTQVSLIDPALATGGAQAFYTLSTTTIPGDIESYWYLAKQDDEGLAVAAYNSASSPFNSGSITVTVNVLILPAGGLPETYGVTMTEPTGDLPAIRISDHEIILSPYLITLRPEQTEQEQSFSIYRVPRSRNSGSAQADRQVVKLDLPSDEQSGPLATIHLGRTLIAYTRNENLHVMTQDGQVDLMLESGVPVIYENRSLTSYNNVLR